MSDFPTLYPDSISFDHGLPQVSEYTSFGVGPVRFKHNNLVNRQVFELAFLNVRQASVDLIRDHYNQNQGIAGEFSVPLEIFGGIGITGEDSVYRYVTTPTEEHFGVYYNVTVTLEAIEGLDLGFILNGGPATLPAEESFSKLVFDGTAPFILVGSTTALATLILNAD